MLGETSLRLKVIVWRAMPPNEWKHGGKQESMATPPRGDVRHIVQCAVPRGDRQQQGWGIGDVEKAPVSPWNKAKGCVSERCPGIRRRAPVGAWASLGGQQAHGPCRFNQSLAIGDLGFLRYDP